MLRNTFLAKRKALSVQEMEAYSAAVHKLFFKNFNLENATWLHTFLPIKKQQELNIWPIIQTLRAEYPNIKLATSVSNFSKNSMDTYALEAGTIIKENAYGIPEPIGSRKISEKQLDIVLVPLLVADATGHRVGYGKGFYDRFLALCRPGAVCIGLSLFPLVAKIEDVSAHDQQLDFVITPAAVHVF